MNARLLLLCALLLPVVAYADGCVLSARAMLERIKETDQVAVIHCAPKRVDVAMFIAIDGIPEGETVTYVLPFQYEPVGFALQDTDGKAFYDSYVAPAREPLIAMNEAARYGPEKATLTAAWAGGFLVSGPFALGFTVVASFLGPTFGRTGRPERILPYATITTPTARAEMYRVQEKDLAALAKAAGLPDSYADVLKRYHTEHFTIMHLTGVKKENPDADPRGVQYTFHHDIPTDGAYTYTYPLGTGAMWPNPIPLTEVYVTCDPGWYLNVTAPIIGKKVSYTYAKNIHIHADDPQYKAVSMPPQTARILSYDNLPYPNAWHRAYLWANPAEDVVVHVMPTPNTPAFWLDRAGRWTGLYFLWGLLNIVLAWTLAGWLRMGLPPRGARQPLPVPPLPSGSLLAATVLPFGVLCIVVLIMCFQVTYLWLFLFLVVPFVILYLRSALKSRIVPTEAPADGEPAQPGTLAQHIFCCASAMGWRVLMREFGGEGMVAVYKETTWMAILLYGCLVALQGILAGLLEWTLYR